ncbi:MAG: ROK family protein, partial [Chloroflexi bacterium]|nr:ROK family protein [Chloroflexota bacterium]
MRCAVDIGATRTMFALVEADAPQVIAWERPITDSLFKGELPPVQALAEALRAFVTSHEATLNDLSGIGIGVPGVADRRQGLVISCPNLPILDGLLLGPLLSQELGLPVYVDNNTNLICLGEHTAGLGQGIHNLAVIFVGSGVGCGLIINDELYEGSDGAAGEFGHMIVVPNGLQCSCGAHGCLEMYCSGKA